MTGTRFRSASVPRLLLAFVLLVALLLALLAGAGWAITASVTRVGPLGDCARIGLCVRTPLNTIEQRTGIQLPAGTERLRSRASRDGSYVSALVRLPEGAPAPELSTGTATSPTARASAALRSAGAEDLSGTTAGPVGVFVGIADGRTVVFVRYDRTAG